jgi:uncharacterized membrane protein
MKFGRYVMGAVYVAAGIGHFVATRMYTGIMPDYLPAKRELVLIAGVAEIAGGVGLMVRQTKRPAAWGIVVLLVAVFPANVWMVQHPERFPGLPLWALWARLPLQAVLIWWAWKVARPRQRPENLRLESQGNAV